MTKKYILKIALIYTGTILGAGFATGKELVNFFGIFGKLGIIGFFIACILLSICAMSILNSIYESNAKTYANFMYNIFGKLGIYIQYFNMLLLFVLFSAMLAGGGASISTIFCINEYTGLAIFCLITFIALIFGKNAVININTILCPVLIVGGMLIGLYIYFFDSVNVFSSTTKSIISPFIYTSYNAITTISVLFSVIKNISYIKDLPLPILALIDNKKIIKYLYSFTVLSAIFTTAVSNGVALEDNLKNILKIKGSYLKIIIILLGILFSTMGFSSIVSIIYPLFGYLGMFEILVIIIMFLPIYKNKK